MISGFTAVQAPALRLTFESLGLAFEQDARQDGWMLMLFRRAGS